MRTNYNIKLPISRKDDEKKLLLDKIDKLGQENKKLKEKIDKLEEEYIDYYTLKAMCEAYEYSIQKMKYELERREKTNGRPERFSFDEKQLIRECRKNGMSIGRLAAEFSCSTSTIHSITRDIQMDLRGRKNESGYR